MINVATPLTELTQTVTRPIVLGVIDALARQTLIPADARVLFPGANGALAQNGSTIDYDGPEYTTFGQSSKYTIRAKEQVEEDTYLWSNRSRNENPVVFYNDQLPVIMQPVYGRTTVTVEIEYQAEDSNEAQAWLNDMRYRISLGRQNHVHNASYAYLLPREYIVILAEIYRLRERQGGYNETFKQFMDKGFNQRARIATSLDGRDKAYEVPEDQQYIVGAFDFSDLPEENQEDTLAAQTISMTYTFSYDKPYMMQLQYPYIIHNQLLGQKYRTIPKRLDGYTVHVESRSRSTQRYEQIRAMMDGAAPPNLINSPTFDVWEPRHTPSGYLPFLGVLMQVDPQDPRALCNLGYLGDINLTPLAKSFVEQDADSVLVVRNNPIWVGIYEGNDTWLRDDQITIDEQLNLRTTFDLSVRKTYHLVVGVMTDLTKLSPHALSLIVNNPEFGIELLRSLEPKLEDKDLLPKIIGNSRLNKHDFNKAVKHIKSTFEHSKKDHLLSNVWVGNMVVRTRNQ